MYKQQKKYCPSLCHSSMRLTSWTHQERKEHLPLSRLLEFGYDMSSGLLHLHKNNYHHNDVAARNFLMSTKELEDHTQMTERQVLCVADFGLSRPIKGGSEETEMPQRPWRWCAPETLRSSFTTNPQTDVWMLGIAFWEALGFSKFPALPVHFIRNPATLLKAIRDGDGSIPLIYPSTTPPEWRILIEKCTYRNPEERSTLEKVVEKIIKKTWTVLRT
eukprot:TRINITY_DN9910_c0_g1_i1.p1 TRINITY_DN9910_c0_g1~~TRINITY_DN9910_c0_g1_i1.p1  ORF type:complete len:218 (-),score=36.49 TRINITY_DN9910_c0_g1_i1:31-684(-)